MLSETVNMAVENGWTAKYVIMLRRSMVLVR